MKYPSVSNINIISLVYRYFLKGPQHFVISPYILTQKIDADRRLMTMFDDGQIQFHHRLRIITTNS